MNEKVNKYLLPGDGLMPQLHSKHPAVLNKPGFTYSASEPFTENKERIEKVMKRGDTHCINQN